MGVNLVKKPNEWIVTYVVNKEVVHERCKTIEIAADFMEKKLKVRDEDIDIALCEMVGYDHCRAVFGDKGFSHTMDQ